jgi:hypothetical protein
MGIWGVECADDHKLLQFLFRDRWSRWLYPVGGRFSIRRYSRLGCGGRKRLLKSLVCRVAGVRAEGYLLFCQLGIPQNLSALYPGR